MDGLSSTSTPPHVLLVCSGLDHARRGYESFARECFEQLRGEPAIRLELVKGSGSPGPGERSIPTLRRDNAAAQALGRRVGFRPFRLEALAFAFTLQPLLVRRRPDLVYLSEWDTARGLAALRTGLLQRFRLLLCNGGFAECAFGHLDHVQELTPAARDHVVERGADPSRHTVLPLGFDIAPSLPLMPTAHRSAIRAAWSLPADRPILVSVAALNRSHKRLDYLIDELAAVPDPRPFALFLGEPDHETPELKVHAAAKLGRENHRFLTIRADQVRDLLRASDAFVLTSLAEMQGRAAVEAMAQGLPCLVHDSPVMKFAVGDHGRCANFAEHGQLTRMLMQDDLFVLNPEDAQKRHQHVYARFSWDALRPRYVQMFQSVAAGRSANSTVSSSTGE